MQLAHEDLLEFMQTELNIDVEQVDDDTPLFSGGILDSTTIVELILFLEQRGGFRITAEEINLDNLDTLNKIMTFVKIKPR